MIKIGITGNIGSGKSYICNIFETKGIPVYYSDIETKKLYCDSIIKEMIVNRLGCDVYSNNESINKALLAQLIFEDKSNLKFIEDLLYPALFQRFDEWCKHQNAPFVLFESAILFEKKLSNRFDKIVFITAPEDIRIQRVINRDKCTIDDVKSRMRLQWSDEVKTPKADYVIVHDGNDDVDEEVNELIISLSRL